jgi:hypothetical protein
LDADTAGSFHGERLSSREGMTNNTRGRFLNYARREDDDDQNDNAVAALSADGIV